MDDGLTPWEDINPPMASAPRGAPPYVSSERLRPALSDEFRDELEACLALVVPATMDEDARAEWLAVAWATLSRLPPDLLRRGCDHARKTCDHPSKIVPAIIREVQDELDRRRERVGDDSGPPRLSGPRTRSVNSLLDRRGGPGPMTEAELGPLNSYLEWAGAMVRYNRDGSKYRIGTA